MILSGTVAAFDEARGLGEVVADDGEPFGFHCTAIADGTRTIAVGTRVAFEPVAGLGGRYEARSLVVPAGAAPGTRARPRKLDVDVS